jgi:hypothetical protein
LGSADATVIRRCGPMPCLVLALILLALAGGAAAQDPTRFCREKGTDDELRPIPQTLVPAAKRLFGLVRMPEGQIRRSTVFRCADGHTMLCTYGANLPCGKANSDRRLPGAEAWCRDHPSADFIPRYAIPAGNIYGWRCAAGIPEVVDRIEDIDPRGFVARYWKPAD